MPSCLMLGSGLHDGRPEQAGKARQILVENRYLLSQAVAFEEFGECCHHRLDSGFYGGVGREGAFLPQCSRALLLHW